jgi:hypothetical protein
MDILVAILSKHSSIVVFNLYMQYMISMTITTMVIAPMLSISCLQSDLTRARENPAVLKWCSMLDCMSAKMTSQD